MVSLPLNLNLEAGWERLNHYCLEKNDSRGDHDENTYNSR